MLSQRGKPLLVHDGHTFGIQYVRKDKKYWQCNLSRKFNCKARVTTTESGDIIVTNNEHCHTEIRQHLRKDYKMIRLHTLSQNLRDMQVERQQQEALQMNLERLRAAAAQQHSLVAAINLNNNNTHHDNMNNNNGNGGCDSRDTITHIVNNKNNIMKIGEEKDESTGDGAAEPSKYSDWKEDVLRTGAALREDLK